MKNILNDSTFLNVEKKIVWCVWINLDILTVIYFGNIRNKFWIKRNEGLYKLWDESHNVAYIDIH